MKSKLRVEFTEKGGVIVGSGKLLFVGKA